MKPNIVESLTGLKRVLATVIRPEISDGYALKQLEHALLALDDLASGIPTTFAWLLESTDVLKSILNDFKIAAGKESSNGELSAAVMQIREELETANKPMPPYPTLDELETRVDVMRVALAKIMPALLKNAGDIDGGRELEHRIRTYLRQNAERS